MLDSNGDPALLKAEVKIPQVQELLGTDAATTIRLFQEYVDGDFDAATGVFAEIAKPKLPMTAPTALAGMEPDTLGVTSAPTRPAVSPPQPRRLYAHPLAGPARGQGRGRRNRHLRPGELLRRRSREALRQLRPGGPASRIDARQERPKLRTTSSDIPNGKPIVTTLDWEPEVENKDLTSSSS